MNKTKRTRNEKSTYCIAVIKMKKAHAGSDVRIDQYAELIGIDDNVATIESRKFGVSKDDIEYISISFATNSNAHLGFCGQVTNVVIENGTAIYTVDIPKTKQLIFPDGTIMDVPNENLIKYNNIHKAKRTGSMKKNKGFDVNEEGEFNL